MILPTLILSLFLSSSSLAQVTTNLMPSDLQILGKGIQNKETSDIVLMACVSDCNEVRLLKLKSGLVPTWLGNSFPVSETANIQIELEKLFEPSWTQEFLSFFAQNEVYALTSKNGWNWSQNPLQIRDSKFNKAVSTMLYVAEYHHSLPFERPIPEATPTPSPTPRDQDAPCGLTGTVSERIKDCATDHVFYGQKTGWQLVTKTAYQFKVWRDPSGLIWGDRLQETFTHDQALAACNGALEENGFLDNLKFYLPSKAEYENVGRVHATDVMVSSSASYFWTSSKSTFSDVDGNVYQEGVYVRNNSGYFSSGYEYTHNTLHVRCVAREN